MLFVVSTVVFLLTHQVGDPVDAMLPIDASLEERAELRSRLGLDRPLAEQYVEFMRGVVTLDFGDSIWQNRPALDIVRERLPKTLTLTASAMVVAIPISCALGVTAARRPNGKLDRTVSAASLLGLSIPSFWTGIVLILVLSVQLGWLPTSGSGGLKHLVMPVVALALPVCGRLMVLTRSLMIDEFNRPWIKAGQLRGLSQRRLVFGHALRNASIPLLAMASWEVVSMLAGATIVAELIFAWAGLGMATLDAVLRGDLVLIQTIVIVISALGVLVNIVIDILYKLVDPRVRAT